MHFPTAPRRVLLWFWLTCLCAALPSFFILPSAAHAAVSLNLQGINSDDGGQILFRWDRPVRFTTITNGNQVTIRFSEPVQGSLLPLLQDLRGKVNRAQLTADRQQLVLQMDSPYTASPILQGNSRGVQLMRRASTESNAPPTPAASTEQESIGSRNTVPRYEPLLTDDAAEKPLADPVQTAPIPRVGAQELQATTPRNFDRPIDVSLSRIGDNAQLRFHWPAEVPYTTNSTPRSFTITFDAYAKNTTPLPNGSIGELIKSIRQSKSGDKLRYQIQTPEGVNFAHRKEGNSVIVEVLPSFNLDAAPPQVPKPRQTDFSAFKAMPVAKPKREALATLQTPAKVEAPEITKTEPPAPAPAETNTEEADEEDDAKQPEVARVKPVPLSASFASKEDSERVTFPWSQDVAAALYQQNNTAILVFDRPANIALSDVNRSRKKASANYRSVRDPQFSITQFTVKDGYYPHMEKAGKGWALSFQTTPPVTRGLSIQSSDSGARGGSIQLPIAGAKSMLTLENGPSGLPIKIIPIKAPGFGISPARQFVDVSFPETIQGIVIAPRADTLGIELRNSGIRVTSPYGLRISPDLPQPQTNAPDDVIETGSFFPFKRWGVQQTDADNAPSYNQTRNMLETLIANELEAEKTPSSLRLQLAKRMMAEDLFVEALGMLELIEQTDPEFFARHYLHALKGLAEFMRNDSKAALKAFNNEELKYFDEIDFWKMITRIARDNWPAQLSLGKAERGYLKRYSPRVAQKVSLLLADKFITDKNYSQAVSVIERLRVNDQLEGAEDEATLLLAKVAANTNRVAQAVAFLEPMAAQLDDRKIRAISKYALTNLLYTKKMITQEEALKRMDALRSVWRGDETEREVLRAVGQLHMDAGNYKEALQAWKELVTYFPGSKTANSIATRMADSFIMLFNRGGVDKMTPLETLSLYYEFRELTPPGKEGDTMIQNLADRLVRVDLLNRAAALLTHQVRFRLKGEDLSRVGARLALIHLFNNAPKLALEVLEATHVDKADESLIQTRKLLMAEAYLKSDQPEQTLALVENDQTPEGRKLTIAALWEQQNWQALSYTLQNMLEDEMQRLPEGAPATHDMAEKIIRLAIAQHFMDSQAQLAMIRNRFGGIMQDTPFQDSFVFLTEKLSGINHQNIRKLEGIISEFSTFIEGFRDKVQDDSLSKTIE